MMDNKVDKFVVTEEEVVLALIGILGEFANLVLELEGIAEVDIDLVALFVEGNWIDLESSYFGLMDLLGMRLVGS